MYFSIDIKNEKGKNVIYIHVHVHSYSIINNNNNITFRYKSNLTLSWTSRSELWTKMGSFSCSISPICFTVSAASSSSSSSLLIILAYNLIVFCTYTLCIWPGSTVIFGFNMASNTDLGSVRCLKYTTMLLKDTPWFTNAESYL